MYSLPNNEELKMKTAAEGFGRVDVRIFGLIECYQRFFLLAIRSSMNCSTQWMLTTLTRINCYVNLR